MAEFTLRTGQRDIQVVATLTDIDREPRHHLDLGPPDHVWGAAARQRLGVSRSGRYGSWSPVAALDLAPALDLGVELGAEQDTVLVIHSQTRNTITAAEAP